MATSKTQSEILLTDILHFEDLKNVRIKFDRKNRKGRQPIFDYLSEPELTVTNGWLLSRHTDYYGEENIANGCITIGLVQISKELWLLTAIKKVTGKTMGEHGEKLYKGEDIIEYQKYFGRVIVRCPLSEYNNLKSNIAPFFRGSTKGFVPMDVLTVAQILPTDYRTSFFDRRLPTELLPSKEIL